SLDTDLYAANARQARAVRGSFSLSACGKQDAHIEQRASAPDRSGEYQAADMEQFVLVRIAKWFVRQLWNSAKSRQPQLSPQRHRLSRRARHASAFDSEQL